MYCNNCSQPTKVTMWLWQVIVWFTILRAAVAQESAVYDCGRITPVTPLEINGEIAKRGEFPWHVGIYYYKLTKTSAPKFVCGGSLINNKLVVTAAHCCWDDQTQQVIKTGQLGVAGGKIYRQWRVNAAAKLEVTYAQFTNVSEILLPEYYDSYNTNYADDIALLVLEPGFHLTPYLSPVCLNFERDFQRAQLASGKLGKIPGWGLTSIDGKSTQPQLRMLQVPLVSWNDCIKRAEESFLEFITADKFCAAYTNGTAVCKGDSGGGLVIEQEGRHYLRGVASIKPLVKEQCNYTPISTFTNVSVHRDFILRRYEDLYWHECGRESDSMEGNRRLPWHAHLYRDDKLLCGATLIRDDLVITGATAVWDVANRRIVNRKLIDITMPAGVERFTWDAARDSQTSQVLKIAVAPSFNPSDVWLNNLAVLHVERFRLTPSVRPVCLETKPVLPSHGDHGKTLYGRGNAAREVSLVVLKEAQCDLTNIWFCAQLERHTEIPIVTERHAGLAFPVKVGGDTRYFLRGVLAYVQNGVGRKWTRLDIHQEFLNEQWAVRL